MMGRRSQIARGGLVIVLAAAACSVTEQRRPDSGVVAIAIEDPYEIPRNGALRYAVIWTVADANGAAALITDDGPLTSGASAGGFQFVELTMPSPEIASAVVPAELLEMQRGVIVQAFRPRVLIYEDADRNEVLTPSVLGGTGLDRILAIDRASTGPSVAALLDVETTLASLSLEATAAYYEATGDVFTPFIRAEETRGGLGWRITDQPLALSLTEGPRPAVELACLRQPVPGVTVSLFATSRVDGLVDVALDADATCGVFFETCESLDFAAESAPDLDPIDSDWRLALAQCRDGGRVQVLVVHRAELECEPCACRTDAHAEAWVADPASLPPWWPCGDTVDWCDSDLPLYTIDPLCVPEQEEEEG